jgi:hypothetical protein
MNYVDRGSFGMDRAEKLPEHGRPDAAKVWGPYGGFEGAEIFSL